MRKIYLAHFTCGYLRVCFSNIWYLKTLSLSVLLIINKPEKCYFFLLLYVIAKNEIEFFIHRYLYFKQKWNIFMQKIHSSSSLGPTRSTGRWIPSSMSSSKSPSLSSASSFGCASRLAERKFKKIYIVHLWWWLVVKMRMKC